MIACPASLAANEPTGTQIVAPSSLKVEAPGQINFDVRVVAPRGVVPSFSIVIRGLPVSVKLSAGEAIGSNTWKVPVLELAGLKMTLMAGAVGKSELELTLVTSRDVVLASASSELIVERPAVAEALPARGAAEKVEKGPQDPLSRYAAAEEARKAEEAEGLARAEQARKSAEARTLEEGRKAAEAEQARKAEEVTRLAEAEAEEARKAEEAEKVAATQRAEQALKAEEARKLAEAEARKAEEGERLKRAEQARKTAEARTLEEARKATEAEQARKAEEVTRLAEAEAEEARKAEEAEKLAAAQRMEQVRKAAEVRKLAAARAEEARKAQEAEKLAAEQARKAEGARKLAEAKAEEAKKAEAARKFAEVRAEEARKLAEAKAEEARKAEAQAQQISSSPLTAASGVAVAALPEQRHDPEPTVVGPTHAASTAQRPQSERLFTLGERYRAEGNIVVARQYFLRAAQLGLASAAFKLAVTYDPYELERLNTRGLNADLGEAKRWYARAAEFGAEDAKARLVRLGEK